MYCRLCLCHFPTLQPLEGGPAVAECPACGALELRIGSPAQTLCVQVGRRANTVLIDAPRAEPWLWRIRVPVFVTGAGPNATPNLLRTIHDTEIAPALRLEGFVPEAVAGPGYRAMWSRTVGNPEATTAFVHAVSRLPTTVDGDAFLAEHPPGALVELTAFAHRLPAGVYVSQLTPWGMSLTASDGRALGVLDSEGRGRLYAYLMLPYGVGARAARSRSAAALEWFEATRASAWRAQGFEDLHLDRAVAVGSLGHGRRAIRLWLRFLADTETPTRLAWASQNGWIELD